MKNITTKLLLTLSAAAFATNASAQCADYTYYDKAETWSTGETYKSLEIVPAELTEADMTLTGAESGRYDNLDWAAQAPRAPYGSGEFKTAVWDYNGETEEFYKTENKWSVKYHNCVLAPTHETSAYDKLVNWGEDPSGKNDPCTKNDNSCYISKVYDMKGFIEMNRMGTIEGGHGYVQIDNLNNVDRIQWAFSSTSWKRGVKCDIKVGDGEWTPQRWVPSDVVGYATFAEQGYEFDEILDRVEDETPISVRFRIWDGDDITFADLVGDPEHPEAFSKPIDPTGTYQTVRIHKITVYTGVPLILGINTTKSEGTNFKAYKAGNAIVLSQEAKADLYNLTGSLVKSAEGKKINTYGLAKGTYIVRAKLANGKVVNQKIAL